MVQVLQLLTLAAQTSFVVSDVNADGSKYLKSVIEKDRRLTKRAMWPKPPVRGC